MPTHSRWLVGRPAQQALSLSIVRGKAYLGTRPSDMHGTGVAGIARSAAHLCWH